MLGVWGEAPATSLCIEHLCLKEWRARTNEQVTSNAVGCIIGEHEGLVGAAILRVAHAGGLDGLLSSKSVPFRCIRYDYL